MSTNISIDSSTISIGLEISEKGDNVFKDADKNLYVAENNGKNQLV